MTQRCAPWCGHGCTQEEYDRKRIAAEGLADRLDKQLGGDWRPRVWENLGWHYSVISECGRLKIHPNYGGGYTTFLNSPDCLGGRWAEHGTTPRKSIRAVLNKAQEELKTIAGMTSGLEQYL